MPSQKKTGASTLKGGRKSRQQVAVILEALSGESGVTEASEKLGISLSRYYQLETKALEGMLAALEPRGKGPQRTPEREIKALVAEKKALEKELRRHQTLLRAAHRTVGFPTRRTSGGSSTKRGRVKRGCRGRTVRQTLLKPQAASEGTRDGTSKRDGDAGGSDAGQSAGT